MKNNFVNCLLNDTKGLMSSFIHWKKDSKAEGSYEFYVDKAPYNGNFGFLGGVDEVVNLLQSFKYHPDDLEFISSLFNKTISSVGDYMEVLKVISLDDITIYGLDNGSEFFAKEPIMTITGPIWKLKLLIFPISNLLSFSSLICTTSVRMRLLAEDEGRHSRISLLEFGVRRAQGPLAGYFASKYAYLGSFNSVSNVLNGAKLKIPVAGTCAHAYIMSFQGNANYQPTPSTLELFQKCLTIREQKGWNTNLSELTSFVSFLSVAKDYASLLVDTYNTLESGVKNAIILAIATKELYGEMMVKGIRLDSGDLAEISKAARKMFISTGEEFQIPELAEIHIIASNDINENSIKEFNHKTHEMDVLGIGTNLVTCLLQPFMVIEAKLSKSPLMKIFRIEGEVLDYVRVECPPLARERTKVLYQNGESFNEKDLDSSRKALLENLIFCIQDFQLTNTGKQMVYFE